MQASDSEIIKIWNDIEQFFKDKAPIMLESLNAGLPVAEITAFEKHINLSLPKSYKLSLEKHNGDIYLYSYSYLSLEVVQEKWEMMKRLKDKGHFSNRTVQQTGTGSIQDVWWHESWIPFAEDSGGNFICIDMAPGPNGHVGQIIEVEKDDGPFETEFKSFSDWLKNYRDGLFSGSFIVNDEGTIDEV